jgi:hypothetical protein
MGSWSMADMRSYRKAPCVDEIVIRLTFVQQALELLEFGVSLQL